MSAYRLVGLRAGYGEREVLHGLTLAIPAGTATALVGPGGSGKSTLLALLAGVQRDGLWSRGRLSAASGAAYVGQKTRETRSLGELIARAGRDAEGAIHDVWAGEPDLAARLRRAADTPISGLGAGLARLAHVTAALATPAAHVLLDEPEFGLEAPDQDRLARALGALDGDARTLVVVTHNLRFARAVASHCILLVDGVVVEAAAADEFFESPKRRRTQSFVRFGS